MLKPKHILLFGALIAPLLISGCTSSTTTTPPTTTPTYYTQTNLVSDTANFAATHTDANLVNAWGIAFGSTGKPWISSNGAHSSVIYDTTGLPVLTPVTIPVPGATTGGAPSGVIFNASTTDFGGNKFIFCTEDGAIAGWASGGAATIVSDSSGSGAVYKGIALVASSSQLYATDFHNNEIVVFDKNFNVVNHFNDGSVPAGYAPFGIQNIHDTLYVTYALQKVGAHDDSSLASTGFVDRFTPAGVQIGGHFASGGNLNSPWGIALAPASWGQFANAILVGNFGDGKITGFTQSGTVIGQLMSSSSSVITIDGLWGISFNPAAGSDPNKLYFTAGPFEESHGLFGYLH